MKISNHNIPTKLFEQISTRYVQNKFHKLSRTTLDQILKISYFYRIVQATFHQLIFL